MVLKNSLSVLSKTYTPYWGGYLRAYILIFKWFELFIKLLEMWTLSAIDVFYGLVSIEINWIYVNISLTKQKHLGFSLK